MFEPRIAGIIAGFNAEHRTMTRMVREVDRRLQVCETAKWTAAAVEDWADALTTLLQHIEHHFAQEEEGGYMEEALTLAPRFTAEAHRLANEHTELLAGLVTLLGRLHRADGRPETFPDVAARYHEWRTRLLDHERAENDVLAHAFNVEMETA